MDRFYDDEWRYFITQILPALVVMACVVGFIATKVYTRHLEHNGGWYWPKDSYYPKQRGVDDDQVFRKETKKNE